MTTNYQKIQTAITNALGTDSAVKNAFRACADLRIERGLMTKVSNETGLNASTIKLYAIGGEILAKLQAELVKDDGECLKIRAMVNESRTKGENYRALKGEELDGIILEWDGSTLGALFLAVQNARYVEPVTPEEPETEPETADESKGSLLDVVLSALPNLTAEELALVADSVAQLMTQKTLTTV
jgi:hypothetical protein